MRLQRSGVMLASLIALDLFAGAGGLSMGMQQAGFAIAAAVESDADAAATYRGLHPHVPVLEQDAQATDFNQWRGAVDVVCGGPPCQPFSSGGKRLGQLDSRDGLPTLLAAVSAIRPNAVLIENVGGLATGSRRAYFIRLIAELEALGYVVSSWVLDAADYGVPQHRRRLFVVGLRRRSIAPPTAMREQWLTAGDALDAIDPGPPNRSPVVYAKLPHIRPSPHTGLLYNGSGRPIDLSAPAPTILAIAGGNKTHFLDTVGAAVRYHAHLVRGGRPRVGNVPGAERLTVAQSAALQGFPPGADWQGKPCNQYRQVGNAVPPPLARAVAKQVAAAMHGRRLPLAA